MDRSGNRIVMDARANGHGRMIQWFEQPLEVVYQLVGADVMKLVSVALFLENTTISLIDIEFPKFRTFYLMYLQGSMLWIMGMSINADVAAAERHYIEKDD